VLTKEGKKILANFIRRASQVTARQTAAGRGGA